MPRGRPAEWQRAGIRAGSRPACFDGCLDDRDATKRWHGATPAREPRIAQTCNNCHGTNGISADAIIPNLAGQSAAAIYKQLDDFRSGKRDPAVMGVYVSPLSEQDLLDLAAHYASLPNPAGDALSPQSSSDTVARRLIEVGDPLRGIAPCASCHGPLGVTPGAPGLRGQQRAYLELQMQSFKDGNRRNDISEQMRSVARQLTGEEIAMLAAYYSSIRQWRQKKLDASDLAMKLTRSGVRRSRFALLRPVSIV